MCVPVCVLRVPDFPLHVLDAQEQEEHRAQEIPWDNDVVLWCYLWYPDDDYDFWYGSGNHWYKPRGLDKIFYPESSR